jgi:hypothetical protein
MRDTTLLALRPTISTQTQKMVNPDEVFQNQTLRPILKLQHPLLLGLLEQHISSSKVKFTHISAEQRAEWIATQVRTNPKLGHLLIGTIVGHFSMEELAYYVGHEAECKRRILQLLIQRLQSAWISAELPAEPR